MYQYTAFDKEFIKARAAQYRDQLSRNQSGKLSDDEFKPLRLQNGWYIQRYAPMLRVAVPYGELSAAQLRMLARIAREYDQPSAALFEHAQSVQDKIGTQSAPALVKGVAHFTTRQNVQYNWIALDKSADVMDLLASVDMHGIQTSGNCIRNITSDERAGIADDEVADPRPYAEILRQWSTLHPEFAYLPRKFKIAITGAKEDRAAISWHDVGLQLHYNSEGELGFKVLVGGGMGRTPVIAPVLREFLPHTDIITYLEAVVRVYNRWGRRDNIYKARIKILVKAEFERFAKEVQDEFERIKHEDNAPHTITQAELDRVSRLFEVPQSVLERLRQSASVEHLVTPPSSAHAHAHAHAFAPELPPPPVNSDPAFKRWLKQNVVPHKLPEYRIVTLSFKRIGQAPGDASVEQLEQAANLCEHFSASEVRVTHSQNLVLPWVHESDLHALWQSAVKAGLAQANIGLLTDMIACPGGDYCALANARSIPVAESILQRFTDLDELLDIGPVDLHISGCINSCGHHHSGHIGVLGVDKDGQEWYQVTLGGSDGSQDSGPPVPGRVVGPSFSSEEVVGVVEEVLAHYVDQRVSGERFIQTLRRVGFDAFKQVANAARLGFEVGQTSAKDLESVGA
jgi:sulfite reductase (NADPH) hemoprotein beta-component